MRLERKKLRITFKKCLSNSKIAQNSDQSLKDAERLNGLLGGLPLAISLAVAYIQQNQISISAFCGLVVKENSTVDKVNQSQSQDESQNLNYVSTILTLAFADLRSKNTHVESILDVLAYLSPDDIDLNSQKECWNYQQDMNAFIQLLETQEKARHWENPKTRKGKKKKKVFKKAFEFLLSYSTVYINSENLAKENGDKLPETNLVKIKIHRLTQTSNPIKSPAQRYL